MKPIKSALACLAVTGLVLSQPAMAANVGRSGSVAHQSEHLAGFPSAAWPAVIAMLAVAAVAVFASAHDHNHHPASP